MPTLPIPTLYWQTKGRKAKLLLSTPFKSEQEFEETVFSAPELLEGIFLLKRQIRGGGKKGIPDILGLDPEGNVCIIEMKNTRVDVGIIPQALEYAIWAESSPDSIKTLWLEAEDRPTSITPDWDNYLVRVLIIAPSIDRSTLEHIDKIQLPLELIEVTRWTQRSDSWLLVNRLEAVASKRVRPVRGLGSYDREAYEQLHNPKSVPGFLKIADEIERLAMKKKWPVQRKFNKGYCAFKLGNAIVFGVTWIGRKSYGVFFKVPERFARRATPKGHKMHRYEPWGAAVFKADDRTKLAPFLSFFKKSIEQKSE